MIEVINIQSLIGWLLGEYHSAVIAVVGRVALIAPHRQ